MKTREAYLYGYDFKEKGKASVKTRSVSSLGLVSRDRKHSQVNETG